MTQSATTEQQSFDKDKLFTRLSKIYALVERGATEGEKQAAKNIFDKLLIKHGLTEDDVTEIVKKNYAFTFANYAEEILLVHLCAYVLNVWTCDVQRYAYRNEQRKVYIRNLTKLEYIQIVAMYEYFRRHMKAEYKLVVKTTVDKALSMRGLIKRNNKPYTNSDVARERKNTQGVFITKYLKASGISRTKPDSETIQVSTMADHSSFEAIQGGKYHEQLMTETRLLD
jgi:hypothetical protein